MSLYIRMALYFILPTVAAASWLDWSPETGHIMIDVDGLAVAIPTYIGFIATFLWSRVAKKKGKPT